MKKILVTGIGGVVGQGIIRNILDMKLDVAIVGTNTVRVSAGNYLCDRVYEVPIAYSEQYIPTMKRLCTEEGIDLIIPSTDYESYYLGLFRSEFLCPIAASHHELTHFCLDKFLNFQAFEKFSIPFAKSCLPSQYKGQFDRVVVKPREGRGSRNIHVNPDAPGSFDDSYVVQEYLEGPEITTTFYVTQKNVLHGFMTMVRELDSGNTSKAEVVFDYDVELRVLIDKILNHYSFIGSTNIQSRVTEKGIIPFEINCRISGTNSVRSQFGFKDVAYTVQELLYKTEPDEPRIIKGTALRVILDMIYPEISLNDISNKDTRFYIH